MIASIYIIVICLMIYRFRKLHLDAISEFIPISYFILKCVCGIGVWILYHDYFKNGDMLGYMKETEIMYQLLKQSPTDFLQAIVGFGQLDLLKNIEHWNAETYNPIFNDNKSFLIFNLLIRFLSFGNVYAQIVWINFASYIGLLSLYKCFNEYSFAHETKQKKSTEIEYLRFIPFILPSVLIFGSALLKESLLLFAFGLFVRRTQLAFSFSNNKNYLYFLISLIFLLFIKPYLLFILLPGIFALFFHKKMPSVNVKVIFISIYCGGLLELLLVGKFFPQFDLPTYLFGQRLNLMRNAIMSASNNLINPISFAPETFSFLRHVPQAIISAFTRPFPNEIEQWWMTPISFDSIILATLIIYLFFKRKILRILHSPFALLMFFSSLVLLMLIGFTIPVIGNLVRFKMPAMLMLALSMTSFKLNKSNLLQT